MQNLLIAIGGIIAGIVLCVAYGHYLIYRRRLATKRANKKTVEQFQKSMDQWREALKSATTSEAIYSQMAGINTLEKLRALNPERCKAFGHTVNDMSITFWATAVAGEAGELCNIIKKMERGDTFANANQEIGKEAADVVIYLDLLCTKIGICLEDYIKLKFNEVSDRVKSPIKL